jgi:hypothetical protein
VNRSGTGVAGIAGNGALIQNQATFVSHLDEDRQRFTKIEQRLANIEALLIQHDQLLKNLPEAIREKIGFKKP